MYLLLGNLHMESGDYKGAIHSFERAQAQMRTYVVLPLFPITLVSFLLIFWRHVDNGQHF